MNYLQFKLKNLKEGNNFLTEIESRSKLFKVLYEMFRQGIVGLSNTFLNYLIFIFLLKLVGVHYLLSNTLASVFSFIYLFYVQKNFTFRDNSKTSREKIFLFSLFFFSYYLIEMLLLYLGNRFTAIDLAVIKVITVFILFFYSYLFQKFIVFKKY